MKRHILCRCQDRRVMLPSDLGEFGFRGQSRYFLHLLYYGEAVAEANLHEILLLPVSTSKRAVERLYSMTLSIKNVPGATAAVLRCLAEAGVDIKTCTATDSIAGTEGTLEACGVLPPKMKLDDLDKHVKRLRSSLGLEEFIYESREQPNDERRFVVGRSFLESRRHIKNFDHFQALLEERSGLDLVAISRGEPETQPSGPEGQPFITLPPFVVKKVNSSFNRFERDDLNGLQAAITLDTEFSCISISVLDPSDIILRTEFEVSDKAGALYKITDVLGRSGVDFRIVELLNVTADDRMLFKLIADYTQTEFTIYGLRTLSWLLFAKLHQELRSLHQSHESNCISSFELSAVCGYPRVLTHFQPHHRFEIIDLWWLPANGPNKVVHAMTSSRVAKECVTKEDEAVYDAQLEQVLRDLIGRAHSSGSNEFLDYVSAGLRDVLHAEESTARRPSPNRVELQVGACQIWLGNWRGTDVDGNYCFAFVNTPPRSLRDTLDGLGEALCNGAAEFDAGCIQFLSELSYGLPTHAEYSRFGDVPQEEFEHSSQRRFGALENYIQEKAHVDEFPVEGNRSLAELVEATVRNRTEDFLRRTQKLRILDIGPGPGALTSCLVMQLSPTLRKLLESGRVELTLLDVSDRVLELCAEKGCDIGDLERKWQLKAHQQFNRLLKGATRHNASISAMERGDYSRLQTFDLVLSGFAHHHLSNEGRRAACAAMMRLTRPGGIVAIADECCNFKDYLEYRINHLGDTVEAANESFLDGVEEHMALFVGLDGDVRHQSGKKWYAFAGVRRPLYFVCYAHEDRDIVESVRRAWEEKVADSDNALWIDREIKGGDRIDDKIKAAIQASRACVMFISEDLVTSEYVREQEALWIKREVQAGSTKFRWIWCDGPYGSDARALAAAEKQLGLDDGRLISGSRPLGSGGESLAAVRAKGQREFELAVKRVVEALGETVD